MPLIDVKQQGIGTLAYPFYVVEYSRDAKPTPTVSDATLFILETRETWVWKDGTWRLFASPTATDTAILAPLLASILSADTKILRELRLIRQGQIEASTCKDVTGSLDDPDTEDQPV